MEHKFKTFAAVSIDKDSNSNELEIRDSGTNFIKDLKSGEIIQVASTGKEARVISISGNTIIIDKRIVSANSDVLLRGEIIIFTERFSYQSLGCGLKTLQDA